MTKKKDVVSKPMMDGWYDLKLSKEEQSKINKINRKNALWEQFYMELKPGLIRGIAKIRIHILGRKVWKIINKIYPETINVTARTRTDGKGNIYVQVKI